MRSKQIHNEKIVLGDRLTVGQFMASEALVFSSQVVVFFLVAVFMSGLLTQQNALLDFVNSKINRNTTTEFYAVVLSLLTTLGVFIVIVKGGEGTTSQLMHRVMEEVSLDMPRVIYASGSSITGSLLATGFFILKNPAVHDSSPTWWFVHATLFALFFFAVGFGLAYWLKRKTHIKPASTASDL